MNWFKSVSSLLSIVITVYILVVLVLTLWPFNFMQENGASEVENVGLLIKPPAIAYTEPINGIMSGQKFTFLIRFLPDADSFTRLSAVLWHGFDDDRRNFYLSQKGHQLVFYHDGLGYWLIGDSLRMDGQPTWVAIVRDGRHLTLFLDGMATMDNWIDPSVRKKPELKAPLVFGCAADGHWTWSGTIQYVGILDRAATPEEFGSMQNLVQEARSIVPSGMVAMEIPEEFRPLKRTLLLSPAKYFSGDRLYLSDILLNIALFVPLGFLLRTRLDRKRFGILTGLIVIAFLCFSLSLTIEVLQSMLPSRNSSSMDILTNTMGSVIGAIILNIAFALRLLGPREVAEGSEKH